MMIRYLPVVLRLEEVELLLDPVDRLVDGQLERRWLRSLDKRERERNCKNAKFLSFRSK